MVRWYVWLDAVDHYLRSAECACFPHRLAFGWAEADLSLYFRRDTAEMRVSEESACNESNCFLIVFTGTLSNVEKTRQLALKIAGG